MDINKLKNIQEPYVFILIGPPNVGKSTFCKKFESESKSKFKVVSRDQIVLDMGNGEDYNKSFNNVDQKKVNHELHRQLTECSKNKENVIIDMTNLSSKRRISNLRYFDKDYTKVAVIFPLLKIEELILRNNKRNSEEGKFVPVNVIRTMIDSYQTIKEIEGFDKIISLK